MYNKVIMVGNLTRDIEVKYLQSGTAIAKSAIATNKRFKSQNGDQKEEVCFIDVTFWGRTAEIVNQYLRRGSKILVEGRLILDQWTDQNGQKRSKHSITVETMTMLGNKNDVAGGNNGGGFNDGGFQQQQPQMINNSQSQQSQNYNQNFNLPQQQLQQPPQQQQQKMPEINIDEEDIPF